MEKSRPNVSWIIADQLRYHNLSRDGDQNIRPSQIDKPASEVARFTNAWKKAVKRKYVGQVVLRSR